MGPKQWFVIGICKGGVQVDILSPMYDTFEEAKAFYVMASGDHGVTGVQICETVYG